MGIQRGTNSFNASLADLKCIQTAVTDFGGIQKQDYAQHLISPYQAIILPQHYGGMIPLALFCYPTSIVVGWHRSEEFKSWLSSSGRFKP